MIMTNVSKKEMASIMAILVQLMVKPIVTLLMVIRKTLINVVLVLVALNFVKKNTLAVTEMMETETSNLDQKHMVIIQSLVERLVLFSHTLLYKTTDGVLATTIMELQNIHILL